MKLLATSLFVVVALLSGCGGGSTGGTSFDANGAIDVPNLNAMREDFNTFVDARQTNVSLSAAELAAKGSARYAGLMIGDTGTGTEVLIGRTIINATFTGGGSLTGQVSDLAFVTTNSEEFALQNVETGEFQPLGDETEVTQLDGALTLSNGAIATIDDLDVIAIGVAGDVTIPASFLDVSETDDQEFTVTGEMIGTIAKDGELFAAGLLLGASPVSDISVDTIIFAK